MVFECGIIFVRAGRPFTSYVIDVTAVDEQEALSIAHTHAESSKYNDSGVTIEVLVVNVSE